MRQPPLYYNQFYTIKKIVFLFTYVFFVCNLYAQTEKRALSHDDILNWNRITETHISNDGKLIVYKQEPWKGDLILKITTPKGEEKTSIIGGTSANITSDSRFVVFTQKPLVDSVRILKLKKTKKEDLPQDKLVVYNLENNESESIEKVKSSKIPKDWAGWIAYQIEAPKDTTKKEDKKPSEGKNPDKDAGKVFPLVIHNLTNGDVKQISAVSSYVFAEEKEIIVFVSEGKENEFEAGVYVYDLASGTESNILEGKGKIKQLTIDKSGEQVAFLADLSEKKEEPNFSLYSWEKSGAAKIILDNSSDAIPFHM